MVTRAFSTEDGNLQSRSIITARNRDYKDVDLSFAAKPSGDIYKKVDAAAVKQAVKTLLLTNYGEKPFSPVYGANLQSLLFNLADEDLGESINNAIRVAISNYEPRVRVKTVTVNIMPDRNDVFISVVFTIINTNEIVTFETTLARLR